MRLQAGRIVWLASVFFTLVAPIASHAQSALIFERAQIRIESQQKPTGDKPAMPIKLDAEVRPEEALRLEYIHTLNTLTPTTAVMIDFVAPTIVALPPMKVYTSVDVLFIAEDGTILQISPSVTLGDMAQPIKARSPVKSFLFLKAGQAAALNIHTQDIAYGKMFTPTPPTQE